MKKADPISEFVAGILSDEADARPKYQRISGALAEAMETGVAGAKGVLPSERSLADHLGVSRVTVRRALEDLAASGMLKRRQGARSSIAPRVKKSIFALLGFSEEVRMRGSEPSDRWLLRQIAFPTPNESMALGISSSEEISRLVRVRMADGVPIALERATVPRMFLSDPQNVRDSLYTALRESGYSPSRGVQRIRAGVMTRAEADALESDVGNPLLIVERRCFLADGRAVEFTETRYNGERYDFVSELQKHQL